jgi:arylsulfatase A-like enzyme
MILRTSLNKIALLLSLGVLVLFCGCHSKSQKQSAAPNLPNVIYILADDLGYGDLGCYGQEHFSTPHIDRLAAEGIRFTRHYAGSSVCGPSRSVLMTGLHTGHTPIRSNGRGKTVLADSVITIAEKMKEAGYVTAMIGKWGLGDAGTSGIPNRQGFDEFLGYLDHIQAHNHFPDFLWHNQDTLHLDNKVEITQHGYAAGLGGVSTNKVQYAQDLFDDKTLSFIKANKDTSFFIYLASLIPHANNEAGKEGMEVPDWDEYATKDWPDPQKGFAAMIGRLDNTVALIRDQLKALGIEQNTLIIFSSDNGPHKEGGQDPEFFDSNGPWRGIKRDLYEGGIRVPMIACWPGTIAAARTTDHMSGFQDVMPTLCHMAGVPSPSTDGISFLPLLKGDSQPQHDFLYWEFPERDGMQAVHKGDWKAIRTNVSVMAQPPVELYHLSNDPDESDNIASDNPEKVAELVDLMVQAHKPSALFPLLPDER